MTLDIPRYRCPSFISFENNVTELLSGLLGAG